MHHARGVKRISKWPVRASEEGAEKVAHDANRPRASSLGVLVCVCTLLSSYRMRGIRKVDVGIIALATDRLIKHSQLGTVAISRHCLLLTFSF